MSLFHAKYSCFMVPAFRAFTDKDMFFFWAGFKTNSAGRYEFLLYSLPALKYFSYFFNCAMRSLRYLNSFERDLPTKLPD